MKRWPSLVGRAGRRPGDRHTPAGTAGLAWLGARFPFSAIPAGAESRSLSRISPRRRRRDDGDARHPIYPNNCPSSCKSANSSALRSRRRVAEVADNVGTCRSRLTSVLLGDNATGLSFCPADRGNYLLGPERRWRFCPRATLAGGGHESGHCRRILVPLSDKASALIPKNPHRT